MTIEILVLPSGRISVTDMIQRDKTTTACTTDGLSASSSQLIYEAFRLNQSKGLFTLAAIKADAELTGVVAYWRQYAQRYLTLLCQTPESVTGNIDMNTACSKRHLDETV